MQLHWKMKEKRVAFIPFSSLLSSLPSQKNVDILSGQHEDATALLLATDDDDVFFSAEAHNPKIPAIVFIKKKDMKSNKFLF